jgi:hypothetical protein
MALEAIVVNGNSSGANNPANTTPQDFNLFQDRDAVTGQPYRRSVFSFLGLEPNSVGEGNIGMFAAGNNSGDDPYAPWGGLDNFLRLRCLEYI